MPRISARFELAEQTYIQPHRLMERYSEIFTPSAPPEVLVGRESSLIALQRILENDGNHPVILGPRGIGKTSLVVHAAGKERGFIEAPCAVQMKFREWAKDTLLRIGYKFPDGELTADIQGKVDTAILSLTGSLSKRVYSKAFSDFSNAEIFSIFREHRLPHLVFVDDFERLLESSKNEVGHFADLLRQVSNNRRENGLRFILAAASHNKTKLFGSHASVHRHITEVKLGPLSEAALGRYLEDTLNNQKAITMSAAVKQCLAKSALGRPFYLHKMGFHTCLVAETRRANEYPNSDFATLNVHKQDYADAKKLVLKELFSEAETRYEPALKANLASNFILTRLAFSEGALRFDNLKAQFDAEIGSKANPSFSEALSTLINKKLVLYEEEWISLVALHMVPFLRVYLLDDLIPPSGHNQGELFDIPPEKSQWS